MPEFLIDAWDGSVTMAFRNEKRFLVFTLTPEEAVTLAAMLADRAKKAVSDDATE